MIEKKKLNFFEKEIKYKFKNNKILKEALTHPSYFKDKQLNNNKSNQFERLEF